MCKCIPYGWKFWQIAENTSFGGTYFGGWAVLAIMIFIAKWLIERAGNLTGPWASFRSVRTKSMIKCNWKLNKSLLRLIWTVFVTSVFTATVYTSFGSPSSRWQTSELFSFGVHNSLEKQCPRMQRSMVNSMPTMRLARLAAGPAHRIWFCNNHSVKFLADELLADCSQNRQCAKINSPPKFPAIRYVCMQLVEYWITVCLRL